VKCTSKFEASSDIQSLTVGQVLEASHDGKSLVKLAFDEETFGQAGLEVDYGEGITPKMGAANPLVSAFTQDIAPDFSEHIKLFQ